jgi:iron(III) transport system substrate-binding protein
MSFHSARFLLLLLLLGCAPVHATERQLNLLCSVQVEWCQAMVAAFSRDTGVGVQLQQKGAGEALAQLRAEAQNPRVDAWFGGSHLVAAEDDLTAQHAPRDLAALHPWARRQHEEAKGRTVGAYSGAIGFGFNTEVLARKGLPPPSCWQDLLNPAYRGEIQMANPNASATAYAFVVTLVALRGEDEAFRFLKALHANINAYTRSGTAPIKAVARGETAISLSFVHDAASERMAGFPVSYAVPCEGTGYEIGSVSAVRGARNAESARRFIDWSLTPAAQTLAFSASRQLQMPSNTATPLPPGAPDLSRMKLVDYDFRKFGSPVERRRLLARWDQEIGVLPR